MRDFISKKMASTEGFEPPTVRLEGACSILLSYVDNTFIIANIG